MREFLKSIHDYPDESKGIAVVIIIVVYVICLPKTFK